MDPGWFEFSSIFNLAFVEGMLLDMGAGLDTRKEHQATWELCEVSLYEWGGWGFLLLVVCASHHLTTRLTFRAYNSPILLTEFLHNLLVGRKFGHRGSLSISLVFCRISLAAGWYCNLNSHLQASVPHAPEDTVATTWHKRILSDFLELEDRTASSYQG